LDAFAGIGPPLSEPGAEVALARSPPGVAPARNACSRSGRGPLRDLRSPARMWLTRFRCSAGIRCRSPTAARSGSTPTALDADCEFHAAREEAQSRRDDPRARPVPLCHQDRRLPVTGQIARRCWRRVAPRGSPGAGGRSFAERRVVNDLPDAAAELGSRHWWRRRWVESHCKDLGGLGRGFSAIVPFPRPEHCDWSDVAAKASAITSRERSAGGPDLGATGLPCYSISRQSVASVRAG
jgi:hypothetical protein